MPIGKNVKVIKVREEFSISIGYCDESDVRINDSSVSRKHATLRFDHSIQEFILQDDCSKFGTLLLIQNPIKLSSNHETSVQIGNTVINLKLEKGNRGSRLAKICSKLSSCFTSRNYEPSEKYLMQAQKRNESPIACEICPHEEKDPKIYNFINYIGRLPPEIYTQFLRQHLEEDRQRLPILGQSIDSITLKDLNDNLKNS